MKAVILAAGEGNAFLDQLRAYQANPWITRLRLYFESVDAWLTGLTKYINLAEDLGAELDLWLINKERASDIPIPPGIGTGGSR